MGRVSEKTIPLLGRNFHLRKFDPETGSYWAMRLFGSMASGFGDVADLAAKVMEFTRMPKAEFRDWQSDCLRHVSEELAAGRTPVQKAPGQYMIPDVDGTLLFELSIHSFMFSISDFFTPDLLDRLMGTILGVMPDMEKKTEENTNESMNGFTSLSGMGIGDNTNFGTVHTP